jgi:hypothetical protein
LKPEFLPSSSLSTAFRWTSRELSFPFSYGGKLEEKVYMLSDFDNPKTYAAVEDFDSAAHMLAGSIKIYGEESIVFSEWLALWRRCRPYPGAFRELCPAYMLKNHEEIFSAAETWPNALVDYLSGKAQLWKSALLITKMPHLAEYITGFAAKNPSVQQFRSFVETVRDFSDVLAGEYDAENYSQLTKKLSPQHGEAMKFLEELKRAAAPVNVTQKDNFETEEILWSFSTHGVEDLERAIEKLKVCVSKLAAWK